MRRDCDLIRLILLEVETEADGRKPVQVDLSASNYSEDQVSYHIRLLEESGFVRGRSVGGRIGPRPEKWVVFDLTNKGHDFLDAIRSNAVWDTVKAKLQNNGLTVTLDTAMKLAIKIAESALF